MTVEYTRSPLIRAEKVLFIDKATVDAIAQAAIVNMVEGSIEMITDCPEEYPTKGDIEAVLINANDQAIDFLNDAMDELKAAVIERVRTGKLTVRVKAMKFCDVDGLLDDIDAQVNFE